MPAAENDSDYVCPDAQLAHVLASVHRELSALAEISDRLQEPIGNLLENSDAPLSQSMCELQDIDRVSQVVHDLAKFLTAVAQQVQPEWRIDSARAVQSLTLNELKIRLHGEDNTLEEKKIAPAIGDCVLL